MPAAYVDPATSRTYPLDVPRWRSDDGGPLMVTPLPGISRGEIDMATRSQWRYRAALPLDIVPVTMGEGCTPLIEKDWGGTRLRFKLEWFAPTGSFKDRGTFLFGIEINRFNRFNLEWFYDRTHKLMSFCI